MSPQIIFGIASFGTDRTEFQEASDVLLFLPTLRDLHINRLDIGARYPPLNPGRAEKLIGESEELSSGFLVDTKVYTDTKTDASGDLTSEAIETSLSNSLSRLRRTSEGVCSTSTSR